MAIYDKEFNVKNGLSVKGTIAIDADRDAFLKDITFGDSTVQSTAAVPLTGGTMTGMLELSGATPQIKLTDNSGTNTGDFWVHVNDSNFYVLPDRASDGASETPYALQLDAVNNIAYTFGDTVLHSGNYNTYAPTKTGTGASGTWGISITGNAATASNGGVTSVNTRTGAVSVYEFPSGTVMLFVQTSAPTGWTKSTTHDNKALRVVSGTAGSGGSAAFTSVFASRAVSGSIDATTSSGSVGATTLSEAQMPWHYHRQAGYYFGGNYSAIPAYSDGEGNEKMRYKTDGTGGSSSHTHGLAMYSHSHTFTGTAINMDVQYVDVIIATKD